MVLENSQSKPLLPFTAPAYPPPESYSLSSSTRSAPLRPSSPPPFARSSSKQIAKAAFSGRRRLGFLLATVLWLYAGASWYTGARPGLASWVPAAPAGLEGVVRGGGVFGTSGKAEAKAGKAVEPPVEAPGLTVLGPEADKVYKLDRPSLAGYQATLEQFIIDHMPPEDSDTDDPTSLINDMRRFFPTPNSDDGAEPPAIPTKLFQTAPSKEPYSSQNKIARASWEKLNPGYDYLIADDADMHQWVQERFALSPTRSQNKRRAGPAKRQAPVDDEEDGFSLSDEPDVEEEEEGDEAGVITFEPAELTEEGQAVESEYAEDQVDEDDGLDLADEDEEWVDPPSQGRGIAAAWNAMAHPPVLRADFWRYLVLAVEGGYYADVDVACLKPMDEWGLDASMDGVAPDGFVFPSLIVGIEADVGDRHDWAKWYPRPLQFSQWTMASARGHPVLLDVLRRIVDTTFISYAEEVAYMHAKAALLGRASPAVETNLARVRQRQDALDQAKPPFRSVMAWTGPGVWTDAILEYAEARWGAKWAKFRGLGEDGWRGGRARDGDLKALSITGFSPGVNHMGSHETTHRAALAKHAFAGSWISQEGARNPDPDK